MTIDAPSGGSSPKGTGGPAAGQREGRREVEPQVGGAERDVRAPAVHRQRGDDAREPVAQAREVRQPGGDDGHEQSLHVRAARGGDLRQRALVGRPRGADGGGRGGHQGVAGGAQRGRVDAGDGGQHQVGQPCDAAVSH